MTAQHLSINASAVVAEIIDGEAILLHLEIGAYYSLNATGSEIWALVQDGGTEAAAVAAMAARYPGHAAGMADQVGGFLRDLLAEGLLVAGSGPVPGGPPELPPPAAAFTPPGLVKYTDMEDLLLLDPIHEADDGGWPRARGGDGS